jgi:hypothetical protein
MDPNGVRTISPPWGPGLNLPKLIWAVSLAAKTGMISAVICPSAVAVASDWAIAIEKQPCSKTRLRNIFAHLVILM